MHIIFTEKPIGELSAAELVERAAGSFDEPEVSRVTTQALIKIRAKELDVESIINKVLSQYQKLDNQEMQEAKRSAAIRKTEIYLERDKSGAPKPTINNFYLIMKTEKKYENVHFNLLSNRPEVHEKGEIRLWTDADKSESKSYIEFQYGIHSSEKHQDAFRLLMRDREYHPILDIVEDIRWDGTERIPHFLTTWARADDSDYTREVSRLIFAGGIHRLYSPGCKFDDVPVLIGTNQGEGKSSLVRWLAIHDGYYSEVTEIEGRKGIEQIEGAWICEIAELLALTKAREQEAVKAYITRQRDKDRRPYAENVDEFPRRCIFIGTTNNEQFLRDKTGNRRFYPVKCHSSGYWLYDHEQECRDYILQCWAEAREKYKRGEMPGFADPRFFEQYKSAQESALEDDWRIGAIKAYLDDKRPGERVCIRQIAHEALSANPEFPRDPSKADSNEIAQIMTHMEGWSRLGKAVRFTKYGVQKGWEKVEPPAEILPDLPFD